MNKNSKQKRRSSATTAQLEKKIEITRLHQNLDKIL